MHIKKLISITLFFILSISGIYHSLQSNNKEDQLICQKIFSEAAECVKVSEPVPHFLAYSHLKNLLGTVFNTADVSPEITGYGGPMEIAVGLTDQGNIKSVQIIKHSETVSYTGNLNAFTEKFAGKSLNDELILGKDIDGISGATISSEAITSSVRIGLHKLLNAKTKFTHKSKPLPFKGIIMVFLLFSLTAYGYLKNNRKIRSFAFTVNFIYFGLILNCMFSIIQPLNASLGKIPNFYSVPIASTLVLVSLLSTLIFGNIYCGSVCPFAFIQECLFKLGRKLRIPVLCDSTWFLRWYNSKYILLFLIILIALLVNDSHAVSFEVFITLFSGKASAAGWTLLIFFLFVSLFNYRFWCRYFCPSGMFLGLLNQFSILKIILNNKKCKTCLKCINTCKKETFKNINGKLILNQSECVCCGNCITNCSNGSLKIRPFYEKE